LAKVWVKKARKKKRPWGHSNRGRKFGKVTYMSGWELETHKGWGAGSKDGRGASKDKRSEDLAEEREKKHAYWWLGVDEGREEVE